MTRLFSTSIALFALAASGCIVTTAPAQAYPTTSYVPGVAGSWATQWGANVANVELQQDGAVVQGSYVTTGAPAGNLSGTFEGNVLTGQWVDQHGSGGGFRFYFSGDGQAFRGTWGSGGSIDGGGNWDGQRTAYPAVATQ